MKNYKTCKETRVYIHYRKSIQQNLVREGPDITFNSHRLQSSHYKYESHLNMFKEPKEKRSKERNVGKISPHTGYQQRDRNFKKKKNQMEIQELRSISDIKNQQKSSTVDF